jgi:hypothetical protein
VRRSERMACDNEIRVGVEGARQEVKGTFVRPLPSMGTHEELERSA